jgi:threonine-phosphate decarboxylase
MEGTAGMTGHSHGGDLARVFRETGIPAAQILDFSANINPIGLPARAIERLVREAGDPRLLMQYPDPEANELRQTLSDRLEVPVESIVVGAGADSLIPAAVRTLGPRRCVIPVPAFSEYERACTVFGCEIHRVPLRAQQGFSLTDSFLTDVHPGDLVILNNPHNPTGSCAGRADMLDRIRAIRSAGATVLVDEAFIDYVPGAAITKDAAVLPGAIAIRSLTKFYGCAGLRVGYAVAAPPTAATLRTQLPAWPVTTIALNALVEALRDHQFVETTLASNRQARSRLVDALERSGCRVFPAAANFVFFEVPKAFHAADVRDRLIREHAILVRDCDSFDGLEGGRYLRVAVRTEDDNQKLTAALTVVFGQKSCHQHT